HTRSDRDWSSDVCSSDLPDTHFVFPLGNIKGDKDEERFRSEILKTWRSFLIEQPFGNLGNWISFYGGEDKQALIAREESREIVRSEERRVGKECEGRVGS